MSWANGLVRANWFRCPERQRTAVLLFCLLLTAFWLCCGGVLGAQEADNSDAVEQTVDRAIKYLLTKQRPDGAIVEHQNETTMTSLAIMAMASAGATTSENSPRGEAMRKALNFVLTGDRQDKDGYFGNRDGSRMYGHGITTLMLTEMLGMGATAEQDVLIHDRCQKAINLILSAQRQSKRVQDRGGWRYNAQLKRFRFISVRMAVDGVAFRQERWAGCAGRSYSASRGLLEAILYVAVGFARCTDRCGGWFSYIPDQNNPTYTMTAAGLLAMQVCGEYESPLVAGAADWLLAHPPQWNERFFFYGTYYYAQGMYQRGGEHATTADRIVKQMLLDRQQADGSWTAPSGEEGGAGKVYSTSLAVLSYQSNTTICRFTKNNEPSGGSLLGWHCFFVRWILHHPA